jgi:hypothetical protein
MVIASTKSLARSEWTSSVLPWVTRLGPLFVPQALDVGDVAQEHRALPARIDAARARNRVLPDRLEELRDSAMGSVFVVVRPIRGENLVGVAAEQEIEFLAEEAVEFLAELLSRAAN